MATIIRTEKRRRGIFGTLVWWVFLAFNGFRYLDNVARYQRYRKPPKPDLTYILVNQDDPENPYPSKIDGRLAKPPSHDQKTGAHGEMKKIIAEYCPGAENPYPVIP